ncbi:Ribonucleotide reductase of class III (anaerobic), activating protein [hydrothermal vent metagenome]|uniref:Ribonucleotide reductase of class III (Anaerobic), activating protein n=1 Tax=hydrothermal vent metagenome TaxID=652676 RepID=A0A3B0YUZ5_9ZZZZ
MTQHTDDNHINIALTVADTQSEGPGRRFAVWVQGCHLRCQGCCNPEMLQLVDKQKQSVIELANQIINTKHIKGVTFLGGEPLLQATALSQLATLIKAQQLTVMVFTGYTWQHIKQSNNPNWNTLLEHTDLLISGPYNIKQCSTKRRWIGSDNQEIHYLTEHYRYLENQPHAWDPKPNSVDINFKNGQLTVNGFPTSALELWKQDISNPD